MIINKINCLKYNNTTPNSRKETETTGTVGLQKEQIKEYNPHSYMDYNISFGARLWRTPSNFYAQEFNQKGMPDTMREYLFDDYEDRQNMPPAQMMRIVFSDIGNAKSLEEVKEMYKDEPLLQNLHDIDYSKFREGTLGDIFALKDDNHPLFKDGSDDLGLYLLKKIYIECKSLKEIIPDFKKDISDYYKDVADIDYSTLKNFGIGYPERGFWRSLSATREEFPYTYKPRKAINSRTGGNNNPERTLRDIVSGRKKYPEKPIFDVPDHELSKITDTIIDAGGDLNETDKGLKKKGFRGEKNDPKRTFICQYLGPIMSITLDRIHASDEMREFFENYDSSNISMRKRMQAYWKEHPDMKELQSLIMSDTIKLFFEVYGADGQNEYFQDLLEYANSIKPERIAQQKIHDELQQEYERELAIYQEPETDEVSEPEKPILEEVTPEKELSPEEQERRHFDEMMKLHNLQKYTIKGPGDTKFHIAANLNNAIISIAHIMFGDILPEEYINLYANFVNNSKIATKDYKIAMQVKAYLPDEGKNNQELVKYVMSDEEIMKINNKLEDEFLKKYPEESRALVFAVVEAFSPFFERIGDIGNLLKLYQLRPFTLYSLLSDFKEEEQIKDIAEERIKCIPELYKRNLESCTPSEIHAAVHVIEEKLRQYDPRYTNHILGKDRDFTEVTTTLAIASIVKNGNKNKILDLRDIITDYLKKHSYGIKTIMSEDLPNPVKTVAMEKIITNMAVENSEKIGKLLSSK